MEAGTGSSDLAFRCRLVGLEVNGYGVAVEGIHSVLLTVCRLLLRLGVRFGLAGCLPGSICAGAVDRGALGRGHGRCAVRFGRWDRLSHGLFLRPHSLLLGVHCGHRLLELGVLGITLLDQCLLLLEAAYLLGVGGGRASWQGALGGFLLVAAAGHDVVGSRDANQGDGSGQGENDGQGLADGRLCGWCYRDGSH